MKIKIKPKAKVKVKIKIRKPEPESSGEINHRDPVPQAVLKWREMEPQKKLDNYHLFKFPVCWDCGKTECIKHDQDGMRALPLKLDGIENEAAVLVCAECRFWRTLKSRQQETETYTYKEVDGVKIKVKVKGKKRQGKDKGRLQKYNERWRAGWAKGLRKKKLVKFVQKEFADLSGGLGKDWKSELKWHTNWCTKHLDK